MKTRVFAQRLVAIAILAWAPAAAFAHQGLQSVAALVAPDVPTELRWVRNAKDAQEVRGAVAKALAANSLTVHDAIKVAHLNNPGLQAAYNELAIDKRPFEQDLYLAAQLVVRLAAETAKAYIRAVAAGQIADFVVQARAAADAEADLARRMAEIGNWSALDYMRRQLAYAEVTALLARAELAVGAAREHLARQMGVAAGAFSLARTLPPVPERPARADGLDTRTFAERFDLQALRYEVETQRGVLGLSRVTGIVDLMQAGSLRAPNADEASMMFQENTVPVFDWSESTDPLAEYTYMNAVHRLADAVVAARSQIRAAYGAYRTAFDLSHHQRGEILALRKRMGEESLLRNNGMLNSVFDLLGERREEIAAVIATIEADRDFFLAETALRYTPAVDVAGIVLSVDQTEAAPHSHGPSGH
ncbi:MAG: TolC family protein [Rhodospirillaceae bacterium]|nr:TolC family protein [Rhodospirillaceae bacterium]